jgi:hypothetical protein
MSRPEFDGLGDQEAVMRVDRISMVASVLALACGGAKAPQQTSAPAPPSSAATGVRVSEPFRAVRSPAALRAFVPEVDAPESGGECLTTRTGGSGALTVTAFFPNRTAADLQVTTTFDSSGRLVRYHESRGVPRFQGITISTPPAQRDSMVRAAQERVRTTTISLDYAIDQAIVSNRGGGKPTDAVLATVREVERLEKLGPPIARLERMRKLCGV